MDNEEDVGVVVGVVAAAVADAAFLLILLLLLLAACRLCMLPFSLSALLKVPSDRPGALESNSKKIFGIRRPGGGPRCVVL